MRLPRTVQFETGLDSLQPAGKTRAVGVVSVSEQVDRLIGRPHRGFKITDSGVTRRQCVQKQRRLELASGTQAARKRHRPPAVVTIGLWTGGQEPRQPVYHGYIVGLNFEATVELGDRLFVTAQLG